MKSQPRYSKEEFARRGDEIYERVLRGTLESGNEGRFVAIDIETGDYEIDADELAASDRLLARVPNAQIEFLTPKSGCGELVAVMLTALEHLDRRRDD